MDDIQLRSKPVVGERLETIGVDWGPKGLILIHREGGFGVYKIPGHSAWAGNYQPWRYHGTRYGIVMISKFAPSSPSRGNYHWGSIDLIHSSEVKPGSAWRAAIKDLTYEVGKLEAGDEDVLEWLGIKRAIRA